ncbi:response regulator [Silvimonas amylolytica]|uniref:DNA-binding response regulator n=1 Tax=Silvimonas amylolytica TaxID=449663 RepID=A0ABQ2PIT0_9NEIS|nr:response regulator [Silvimonas amylolytica]GGP25286.1 DNA-binding response regulator [Silvimonas amylolytica]
MITVIVADDHPVVRAGIVGEIQKDAELQLLAEAASSTELFPLLDRNQCNVVVTDYAMPGGKFGDGLPMLQMLQRRYPKVQLVVMTMLDNPALIHTIQKAGIRAVINKGDKLAHVNPAIHAVHRHGSYMPTSVKALLATMSSTTRENLLSKRETEVLRMCATGLPVVEIARICNRSSKTISTQKVVAMRKLGLGTDYDLYQYAVSTGLISPAN